VAGPFCMTEKDTEVRIAALGDLHATEGSAGEYRELLVEIFPFLGSSRLAEPIDRFHATVAFHGHAHNGSHRGTTLGGVPVYNVALSIMRRENPEHPYFVLEL